MARTKPGTALRSLHHVIDLDWMLEAYRLTRKDGAPGIDGVTSEDYDVNLEANLLSLLEHFRPGRSAHPALRTLQNVLWAKRLYWVLDIDIRKYLDSIPHSHLRAFLDQLVTDGVVRRMIDKWLKAGAVKDGLLHHATEGTPQGGVISPCLSNVFLHHVLDEWFETEVKPRLRGECTLSGSPMTH